MAVTLKKTAFVDDTSTTIDLSDIVSVTTSGSNPTYLVLTVLDRDEYTADATGATGTLTGNGHTLSLSVISGDERGTGIVFTYQASTGRYYNSTYGYLDQLVYTSSSSDGDVTSLSLFGTNNLRLATSYATDPAAMMQVDASGYIGSATVVTQTDYTGAVPSQATPQSIVTAAESFVGLAWNMDGCWTLASSIAADAGAGLPVQSTAIGLSGQANGEWIVAFNGPSGQTGDWESMLTVGEMIVFKTASGTGHIATCVSGSGSTAMLIDNVTYVDSSGNILNLANDGSSDDVIVSAAHLASQEFDGVSVSTVVIYELDTPIVTATVTSASVALLGSLALDSLFSVIDPANKTITSWQVYNGASGDQLLLDGDAYSANSAGDALTAASLTDITLLAGSTATTDTLEVRAYNGSYWGDWTSLLVTAGDFSAMCFLTGTRILTPSGERAVESLTVGEAVVTSSGRTRRIIWIGEGQVLATRGRRTAATPVIVRKGALADNVPCRDLRVTKGHSLYIDGVLIPVEFLVNHRSILWDDHARQVTIHHIELEAHDVLIADGAPAESYRDDGNRWLFRNANTGWGLPPQAPCASVLTGGPVVDAAWRRLLERSGARKLPPLTDEADLHVMADGVRLTALRQPNGSHVFHLSAVPSTVRIVSRSAVPAELGVARDPRPLGVAVRLIVLHQGPRVRVIEAHDTRLSEGFHPFEADNGFRWTDGDAVLPADLFEGVIGPCQLALHIAMTTSYADDGATRRAA